MLVRSRTGTFRARDGVKHREGTQIRRVIHDTYDKRISSRSSHLIIKGQNQGLEILIRALQLIHRCPCRSTVRSSGGRSIRINLQAVYTIRRILITRS